MSATQRRALPRCISIREAAERAALSQRQMLSLTASDPILIAGRFKGPGRNAKVAIDETAFARWMDSRRSVRVAADLIGGRT